MLAACGQSEAPQKTILRLKELREQCKTDRAKLGDELCSRVAEATNRRFFSDSKMPYNPSK